MNASIPESTGMLPTFYRARAGDRHLLARPVGALLGLLMLLALGLFFAKSHGIITSLNSIVISLFSLETKQPLRPWEAQFANFKFGHFQEDGHTLPYRFYQPPNLEPGRVYPLVLLLHGAGERGTDDRAQMFHFGYDAFWKKYPCFIVVPQCPEHPPGDDKTELFWINTPKNDFPTTMAPQPEWPLRLTLDLFHQLAREKPVDPRRLYVSGLSIGGFATWEILQREGDEFAAAMPICGGGDPAYAAQLAKIPLWVFHGAADEVVNVDFSRRMVKAITAAGGHPKYTEYPGVDHHSWERTYANPEVWDWLFAQQK